MVLLGVFGDGDDGSILVIDAFDTISVDTAFPDVKMAISVARCPEINGSSSYKLLFRLTGRVLR